MTDHFAHTWNGMPKFSVIIPSFNRARYLAQAVRSVLMQEEKSYEIIVIDDGSEDNTAEVAETFRDRISYQFQSNKGVSAARNAGIRLASGEWVAFLDSDDEWDNHYLATHRRLIEKYPGIVGSVTNSVAVALDGHVTDNFGERNLLAKFGASSEILLEAPFGPVVFHHLTPLQSCAFRRDALLKTRLFDESLTIAEDLDLVAQMALEGPFILYKQIGARIIRRQEDTQNLSAQFFQAGVRTRLSSARVYGRFLRSGKLSASEASILRPVYASNQRALGNLHLKHGDKIQARVVYKEAWRLDHSPMSAARWLFSFLPFSLGQRLLYKEPVASPAA
jgi:glycosyltransferase involved in cell wall biosynthesis